MRFDTDSIASNIDRESLRERYRREREKRLRVDGNEQYVEVTGRFAHFTDDPYAEGEVARAPHRDHVEFALIGAGLGNLTVGAKLRQAGVEELRLVDSAGDVGGTWYWNRYPGCACDIESYIYMPLLEEVGYIPSMRYAPAAEIYAHARRIAEHFDLYRDACLQTTVTGLRWDEVAQHWVISTDRDDRFTARFVIIGNGPLSRPKLPGVPGLDEFEGRMFHTSRWDYAYTGGGSDGGMDGLQDKTVGIIGTGATAVQCIPFLAADAKQLYVFQRTPSAVDYRGNRPTDRQWAQSLMPGWQRERMRNFTSVVTGASDEEDMVSDGWTAMFRSLTRVAVAEARQRLGRDLTPEERADLLDLADFKTMESIRARVDEIVDDPATAEALKPWYGRWCKRPCFHDEYLPSFNRPNVTLVDTRGRGVDRLTPHGVVVGDVEYPVQCLIFATGFEVGTALSRRVGYDISGRNGCKLSDKWSRGYKTLHGVQVSEFPNLFLLGTVQVGLTPNYTHIVEEQAEHVTFLTGRARAGGLRQLVEATVAAEDAWVSEVNRTARRGRKYYEECTPSYNTNEGDLDNPFGIYNNTYGPGPLAYFEVLDATRRAMADEEAGGIEPGRRRE